MNRGLVPTLLYAFAKNAALLYLKTGWRLRILGKENIPMDGPVIVSANHRSFADPPIVGATMPRRVHFLAKAELFRFRPFGWLISNLNAHPLNRRGDVTAFKIAKRVVADGEAMIVFPEGKRSKIEGFLPAKPGVGMLSLMTKAPILPAYIHNSSYMKAFHRITIVYGPVIRPDGFSDYQVLADEVMRRIAALRESFLSGEA